jgi:CYTH domain-containing protein
MPKEIERQFIINTEHSDWKKLRESLPKVYITQSTIHRGDGNKLRVRLVDDPKT